MVARGRSVHRCVPNKFRRLLSLVAQRPKRQNRKTFGDMFREKVNNEKRNSIMPTKHDLPAGTHTQTNQGEAWSRDDCDPSRCPSRRVRGGAQACNTNTPRRESGRTKYGTTRTSPWPALICARRRGISSAMMRYEVRGQKKSEKNRDRKIEHDQALQAGLDPPHPARGVWSFSRLPAAIATYGAGI